MVPSVQTRLIAALNSSRDPAATVATPPLWTKLCKAFLSKMWLSSSSRVLSKHLIRDFTRKILLFSKQHIYFSVFFSQMIDMKLPVFLSPWSLESKSIFLSPICLTRKYFTFSSPLVREQQSISLKGLNLVLTSALGCLY